MNEMTFQRMTSAPIIFEIFDISVDPEVPYVLTGKTVMFTVKSREDVVDNDDAALISHKITVHIDALNGITGFTPTTEEQAIPVGKYKADICIFDGTGVKLNSDRIALNIVDVVGKEIT